ncbi:MAG: Crossover junction endodeoxyribonuclease RuvC [candidate division TM6 bacterium GW2011_GWE2_41_16]|nr:MAG: Crossover junction endodeoxyribonuclease RuvC [candidate division TM6 bacterium GW2011_GWE2_41_16]
MKFLAIDPGTRIAGFACGSLCDGKISVYEVDILKLPAQESLTHRVRLFHDFFAHKIIEQHIDAIALETPFLGKNAQNFLKLGYLRGILHLLADINSLQLYEYSPTHIRSCIVGSGSANKEQVARALALFFPGFVQPKTLDATDALAVLLCALWSLK